MIKDSEEFRTIAEVCNWLFKTKYKGSPGMGWFRPKTIKGTPLDKYKVWFPRFEKNKTGWKNELINNGMEIISKNEERGKAPRWQKNIVIARIKKKFYYFGIFRLEETDADGTEHWKRMCEDEKIFSWIKS